MNKIILPQYPRTLHLPWNPNAKNDDLIVVDNEADIIFVSDRVSVEEKVDGANSGMTMVDGHPMIRNHNHIIKKGFYKDTPAKMQFASVWNWWHDNKEKFEKLLSFGPYAVYGEWCIAQHGLFYDSLPSWFIAHTLWNYEALEWVDTGVARDIISQSDFVLAPILHWGPVESYEQLEFFANQNSDFASSAREGVYVKVSDGRWITHRFKMVRQGFEQGALWSTKKLNKNKIRKVAS